MKKFPAIPTAIAAALAVSILLAGVAYASANAETPFAGIAGKRPVSVKDFGADGTGRTAAVTGWLDSRHVRVADATFFRKGDRISVPRALTRETTADVDGTSVTVANPSIFKAGDIIRVVGGQLPKRQSRTVAIKVAGDAGDIFFALINGRTYRYAVRKGDTASKVASCLASVIDAAPALSAKAAGAVVTITADVAGIPFSYENVRPTGRGKVAYATPQPNVARADLTTEIKRIDGNMLTVSSPFGHLEGVRIEHDQNRLNTDIVAVAGNVLTLAVAAVNPVVGVDICHDDQPAFQAAQAYAAQHDGYLFAPAGTYYLTGRHTPLKMQQVSLVGEGKGKTVLKALAKNADLVSWRNPSGPVEGIVIRGVTLDGGDFPNSGNSSYIATVGSWRTPYYSTNIDVEDVEVVNSPKVGLGIYNARNVRVDHCRFANAATGLHFGQYDSSTLQVPGRMESYNIWVTRNTFEKIAWIGGMTYANGTFEEINRGEYATGSYRGVHVRYNTFRDCYLVGWEFYTSNYDCDLIGNEASYCGTHSTFGDYNGHAAFSVKYSSDIVISDNRASNCRNGIEIFGYPPSPAVGLGPARNVQLFGNTLRDNYKGVDIWGDADGVDIRDNVIDGSEDAGISVGSDDVQNHVRLSQVSIRDNRLSNGRWGVLVSSKVDDIEIRENDFLDNNAWGENVNNRAAIALIGSPGNPIGKAVVTDNRMLDDRKSAVFRQMTPLYAAHAIAELYGNEAAGNAVDAYVTGPGGGVTASVGNSWDPR